MKKTGDLNNRLKTVRTRLRISQQELATAAGIARQTIGGIESGVYALSLTTALRIAGALGCTVEELFWLEGNRQIVEAELSGELNTMDIGKFPETGQSVRVALGQIGNRWIASPLLGNQAFRTEMIPADGIGTWDATTNTFLVELLDTPEALMGMALIAGCAPALSLWARSAERWHPGLRVHWLHANSMTALTYLARGEVHIAGIHLIDPLTGEENSPFVRETMNGIPCTLINLGIWEEGLAVAPGNPKELISIQDLTRTGVTLVNRERGSGSRLLLDSLLSEAKIKPSSLTDYDFTVSGHREVAQEIYAGRADAGVCTASIAESYGLSFLPLRRARYDLALRTDSLELTAIQQLLGTLNHRWVLSQLSTLGGYDISRTGEMETIV